MHEESLVRTLLKQVEKLANEHHATGVTEVEVEIGVLSGVEPMLVESAFERIAAESRWKETRLKINVARLVVTCRHCHKNTTLPDISFICPTCNSSDVTVAHGEEFRLLNVTLEQ